MVCAICTACEQHRLVFVWCSLSCSFGECVHAYYILYHTLVRSYNNIQQYLMYEHNHSISAELVVRFEENSLWLNMHTCIHRTVSIWCRTIYRFYLTHFPISMRMDLATRAGATLFTMSTAGKEVWDENYKMWTRAFMWGAKKKIMLRLSSGR